MSRRIRASVLILSFLVVLYVLIGGLLGRTVGGDSYKQLAVFSEVLSRIRSDYVEDPDLSLVTTGALRGLLEGLDPYSSYLAPREYEKYKNRQQAEGDVGLILSKRFGLISVVSTLPGSPAANADVVSGDVLQSIGGFSTRDMSIELARILLAGEPGTAVTLSVLRQRFSEPFELELVRARIRPATVVSAMLEDEIGYVKVATFAAGKTEEIRKTMSQLESQGARKLILDLRGCAQGEFEEGVQTADLFLENGSIATIRGQQYPRKEYRATRGTAWRGPLTVLTDFGSAGPAELIASAVLANQRGEVIGTRTHGVGSVQKVIPLDDGSALILSVAKYYSPTGKAIQDTAVEPSIGVAPSDTEEPRSLRHAVPPPGDRVILKALEVLRAQTASERPRKAA